MTRVSRYPSGLNELPVNWQIEIKRMRRESGNFRIQRNVYRDLILSLKLSLPDTDDLVYTGDNK